MPTRRRLITNLLIILFLLVSGYAIYRAAQYAVMYWGKAVEMEETQINRYRDEDVEKMGLYELKAGEFAVIQEPMPGKLENPTILTHTLENGQEYRLDTDQPMTLSVIEGKPGINQYVELNDSTTIMTYDDLDVIAGKTDTGVLRQLEKQETVPVIVRMSVPYQAFYVRNESAQQRALKEQRFNEVKTTVSGKLSRKSIIKLDLPIIDSISAEVDAESLARLEQDPEVVRIELDREISIMLDESLDAIKAREVWNLFDTQNRAITGQGQVIAIIDTGVDYSHPDLGGCLGVNCKVIGGYDCVNNKADPMDDHGHGTHVAATAAGKGVAQNGQQLFGVAPDAKILGYKVLSSGGSGTTSQVICGIDRATADGATVANMSLGGGGNPDDSLSLAVDKSSSAGLLHAVAAGNSGPTASTIGSPGSARTAVTVAASCKQSQIGVNSYCKDPIASFSSRGPVIWNGVDIKKPDISAPGVMICAARWSGYGSTTCYDLRHIRISGTSMATPHVAGALALMRQAYPNYTPEMIKSLAKQTADNLGMHYDVQGAGLINLKKAIPISPKINATPPFWSVVSVPEQKDSLHTQSFSITPINSKLTTLNVSFIGNIPGVTLNTNKAVLNVSGGTSDSFQVNVLIDNNVAMSGEYTASIVLSSGTETQGIIPLAIVVKPTFAVSPAISIDYGFNNPTLSAWTSDTKMVSVTNLRKDISQTLSIRHVMTGNGITFMSPQSITVTPGQSQLFETYVKTDNTLLANGYYQGTLSVSNNTSTLNVMTSFAKYFILRFTKPVANDFQVGYINIHDRDTFKAKKQITTEPVDFYLNSAKPVDIIAHFNKSSTLGTHRYRIIKEGVAINQTTGVTTVEIRSEEAKNQVRLIATDSEGIERKPITRYYYTLQYLPKTTLFDDSPSSFSGADYTIHYFTNFSTNYRYKVYHTWPDVQPDEKMHFFHGAITGLVDKNVAFTNTPQDFKQQVFNYEVDEQSGTVLPAFTIWRGGSGGGSLDSTKGLAIPARQTVYMVPFSQGDHLSGRLEPLGTGRFYNIILADQTRRWYGSLSSSSLPLRDSEMYVGLGPSVWIGKMQNQTKAMSLYALNLTGTIPYSALIRQDYSYKSYASIPLSIFNNGVEVAIGLLKDYTATTVGWTSSNPHLVTVDLPKEGLHELRLQFPYKNKGIDMVGKVESVFDTTKSDKNPPAIKRLYYYANNVRSEVYDPGVSNRLELEFDPVGGSMSSVKVEAAADTGSFTPLTTVLSNGVYLTSFGNIPVTSKLALRLTATDNSSNSLTYTFELPKGTAGSPPQPPPPTATPTIGPSPTPSRTPTPTVFVSPTPSRTPTPAMPSATPTPGTAFCNNKCQNNNQCKDYGLVCVSGQCRNPDCTSQTNCICRLDYDKDGDSDSIDLLMVVRNFFSTNCNNQVAPCPSTIFDFSKLFNGFGR
jgi:subtilisin family serine protease